MSMRRLSPRTRPTLRLVCLSAAVAHAGAVPWVAAAPVVVQQPQSGVVIKRSAQTDVERPQPIIPPAPRAVPPAPAAPAAHRPAIRPAPPSRPADEPLRLRLSDRLAAPSPAPAADTEATSKPASQPTSLPPPWEAALLDALARDEKGQPASGLPALIAEHADALRARADGVLAQRLGWALYRANAFAEAMPWFELALARDGHDARAREGLFFAAQRAGAWQRAYDTAHVAGDAPPWPTRRADVAVQAALEARQRGDYDAALAWLERAREAGRDDRDLQTLRAWTLLQAGQNAAAADAFAALYQAEPSAELAQALAQSLRASGQTARLDALAQQSGPLAELLRREQARKWLDLGLAADAASLDPTLTPGLRGADQPSMAVGLRVRDKSGAPGTSALRLLSPSLDLRWQQGGNLWSLQASAPRLDAGAVPQGVGSTLPGPLGSPQQQNGGVDALLRWRRAGPQGPEAALGWTPSGGAVPPTWIGSLGWRSVRADGAWQAKLRRMPLEDSTLSTLGLRDPATGRSWGRVLRQGVQIGGYQALNARWSLSAGLVAEEAVGENVVRNTHGAVHLGLGRNLNLPGLRYAVIGPHLTAEHWARNLSGFTWGQGGYYSPQRFTSAGVLAVFETLPDRRWIAAGSASLAWQSAREEASDCFPLAPPVAPPSCTPRAASQSHGWGGNLALRGAALLSPHWALEGGMQWQTGVAYRDVQGYVGLRYFFAPRAALFGDDLPRR